MNWEVSGVWGDENMPDVELLQTDLFGTRVSPIIDIQPAIDSLGVIRSGTVWWESNWARYSWVDAEYSLDGGKTYNRPEGPRKLLYGVHNNMELRLKIHLRSGVVDIFPSDKVNIFKFAVVLSDEPLPERWKEKDYVRFEWEVVI